MTVVSPRSAQLPASQRITISYVGHATLLIELGGVRILTDPNFDPRLGRVLRRVAAPVPSLDALPRLDAILISHAHADHLSLRSLRALERRAAVPVYGPPAIARAVERSDPAPSLRDERQSSNTESRKLTHGNNEGDNGIPVVAVSPLATGSGRAGMRQKTDGGPSEFRVHAPPTRDGAASEGAASDGAASDGAMRDGAMRDGATHEGAMHDGVTVYVGAARHQGSRYGFDRWGGRGASNTYLMDSGTQSVFFAGDTALSEDSHELVARVLGAAHRQLDVALLPIGYAPWWKPGFRRNHLSPADALTLFDRLGARVLMPYHWGTFHHVTSGPFDAVRQLERALMSYPRRANVKLVPPGATLVIEPQTDDPSTRESR